MPIDMKAKLADRQLSSTEAEEVLKEAKPEDVEEIVSELKIAVTAAPADALEVGTAEAQKTVNDFLGRLDKVKALPLDRTKARKPDGSMDWLSALKVGQIGDVLNKTAFSGEKVAVDGNGRLLLDEKKIDLTAPVNDAALNALFAIARPGQLDSLLPASKARLFDGLLSAVEGTLPIETGSAGKYRKTVAATATFAALATSAKSLTPAQVDKLLGLYDKAPAPLLQALIVRALDGATLDAAQQTKKAALNQPAVSAELLAAFDRGMQKTGLGAQVGLVGLAFSKDGTAITNFTTALQQYDQVDDVYGLADEEAAAALQDLETYLDGSQQFVFVFGSFGDQAVANAAQHANKRLLAKVLPQLQAANPSLEGVALSADQAKYLETILPGIKNQSALASFAGGLKNAQQMFGTLTPAAFELFKTTTTRAFERKGDNKDHMIDTWALQSELRQAFSAVNAELQPRLSSLRATPPSYDGIPLSAGAATQLCGILEKYLRSELSVANIGGALKVIALANGGKIDAAGEAQLAKVIDTYAQNWPGATVFDFNKLGRMAGFIVQGKAVPLCTINGKQVGLGDFYASVGRNVSSAIDKTKMSYEWMPERWGQRASQAAELLDVIAQQTAEGKGPITLLAQRYPDRAITVHAQGKSGAHDQFVFEVKGVGMFNQASDGAISPCRAKLSQTLFSAKVKTDGTFDVSVAPALAPSGWPLQTTYAVGDLIDIRYADPKSSTNQPVEGKPFSTKHQVLQAKIESYDASGHYTVSYKNTDGVEVKASLTLKNLEEMNNPHNFDLNGSDFSDVRIDVRKQPKLQAFIDGAKPIIQKYLPRDGSLLALTPAQLAKAQRECVGALQAYMRPLMTYPAHKGEGTMDEASKKYHDLIDGLSGWGTTPLENLLDIKRGVCRHQCIIEQILMQVAGIDSRLASGAANTMTGDFRGYHIWNELALADNARYLSDQTWNDAIIPLWTGAYGTDKRRIEMYNRTSSYAGQIVS
ncbi:MAG: transglutaminase domain-containing protein [Deltaproteobacteria bacterium]|nr:transglutaminase domain-containing protein [Deltaproteobacteria bacterium]